MKKVNQLFIIAALILSSCSGNTDQVTTNAQSSIDKDILVTNTEVEGTARKNTAAIVIEGMSCEMACVSSVNKTVIALEGTSNINIHFDADQKTDTCFVDYDETVISPNELIGAIQNCNGGAYAVKAIELIKTSPKGAYNGRSSRNNSDVLVREKVKHSQFSFPSLLDLVKKVGF